MEVIGGSSLVEFNGGGSPVEVRREVLQWRSLEGVGLWAVMKAERMPTLCQVFNGQVYTALIT